LLPLPNWVPACIFECSIVWFVALRLHCVSKRITISLLKKQNNGGHFGCLNFIAETAGNLMKQNARIA
jgi:hypothetical protein